MWIKLDDAIQSLSADMLEEIAGLDSVLCAVSRGEHALAVSHATSKVISQLPLSLKAAAALRSAASKSAENLAWCKAAKFRITVILHGAHSIKTNEFNWELPLRQISQIGLPRCAILAENLNDARLYDQCAKHYAVLSREKPCHNNIIINGGGADTPKVLGHQIAEKQSFVLCITDSDKSSPAAPANATSRNCTKEVTITSWIAHHITIEAREIENIIPTTIIEDVLSQADHSNSLTNLKIIRSLNFSDDEWKYLDLKSGSTLHKCLSFLDYWRSSAERANKNGQINENCLEKAACLVHEKDRCNCYISPGIGEKLLEHTVNFIEKNSYHKTALRTKTANNFEYWMNLGKTICEWGAATERLRA